MISRRVFLERASWGLMTLGGAETPILRAEGLQVFYDPAILRHEPSKRSPGKPSPCRCGHDERPRAGAPGQAGGRVVSVPEAGYSLDGLPPAVTSHLTRLAS